MTRDSGYSPDVRHEEDDAQIKRFPRTLRHQRGTKILESMLQAHLKRNDVLVMEKIREFQRQIIQPIEIALDARPVWERLPRFDPSRVPETRWLIENFLAERSVQLAFGEAGTFKTTLMLYAAKAISSGEKFLGMKTRQRRVLILDFENPASVIKDRSRDIGLELPENENLIIFDRFSVGAVPRPGDKLLEDLVRQCVAETGHGPWLVFDSWASLLKPGQGGESTGQIAPIYAKIRKLVDLGATVTILDHAKKYEEGIVYGGADKEAKSDSIHNFRTFPNKSNSQSQIVTVESRLKRFAPSGEGTFAFEVATHKDEKGTWHLSGISRVENPTELIAQRNIEILRDVIRDNPDAGQQEIGELAAKLMGISRESAIGILKANISKHWVRTRGAHGKISYELL